MVVYSYNPNTWEMRTDSSVWGQPEVHVTYLKIKTRNIKNIE